jgi:hypothetical protein
MRTTRSGSRAARGRRSTAFVRLKIVVFAPMPIASVITATAVNPGSRVSERHAYCRF